MKTQANPPSREPSPSFREAAIERLSREGERNTRQPAPVKEPVAATLEAEDANDPSLQDDEQGVRQPEIDQNIDDDGAVNLADASDEPEPDEGSPEYWKMKAAEAEESRLNMERDYRRKTHKIAETHRAAEDQHQQVVAQAQFFAGMAEQGVRQFDQVNWEQLQQDPAKYQQARQAFITAQQYHRQMVDALKSVDKSVTERRDHAKKREADISREILKSTVPGWNNQMYQDLRAFAVEDLDYSPSEVDDMTDWRRIRDIHSQWIVSKAKTSLKNPPKRTKQPERKSGNAPLPGSRNERGQFQNAAKALTNNPGNRQAKHNFFVQKLRNERRTQSS